MTLIILFDSTRTGTQLLTIVEHPDLVCHVALFLLIFRLSHWPVWRGFFILHFTTPIPKSWCYVWLSLQPSCVLPMCALLSFMALRCLVLLLYPPPAFPTAGFVR